MTKINLKKMPNLLYRLLYCRICPWQTRPTWAHPSTLFRSRRLARPLYFVYNLIGLCQTYLFISFHFNLFSCAFILYLSFKIKCNFRKYSWVETLFLIRNKINFSAILVFEFNESKYGSVGAILNAASRYPPVLVEYILQVALIAIAV